MAIHVLQDPRRYLLAIIPVALALVVPMIYLFFTMVGRVFGPEFSLVGILLVVLLGAAVVGLVAGLMMVLARATRLSDAEHEEHVGSDE